MSQPAPSQPAAVQEKTHGQVSQGSPTAGGAKVFHTPAWVVAIRGFQLLIGLIVMAGAGWLIHGALVDEIAYALVCGLFTWFVAVYALASEKIKAARQVYNVYAILGLDALMTIFWLASMGAVARWESRFNTTVNVTGCFDDGSTINAHTCFVTRSVMQKRQVILFREGHAVVKGIIGLSALEFLLFIATFVWLFMEWRRSRRGAPNAGDVEMSHGTTGATAGAPQVQQQQPTPAPQQQPAPQAQPFAPSPISGYSAPAPVQSQHTGPPLPQQQQPSPHYGQQPIPFQQMTTPGPQGSASELPNQQQTQPMYSPSTSPAPPQYAQQQQYQPPYNPQELPNPQQAQQMYNNGPSATSPPPQGQQQYKPPYNAQELPYNPQIPQAPYGQQY